MKEGDQTTMFFYLNGIKSPQQVAVLEVTDKHIMVNHEIHPNNQDDTENLRFHPKTGKCLNDNTMFGGYRTLKI